METRALCQMTNNGLLKTQFESLELENSYLICFHLSCFCVVTILYLLIRLDSVRTTEHDCTMNELGNTSLFCSMILHSTFLASDATLSLKKH